MFLPDNTSGAVAAVQNAAQATAEVETGRITTTFAVDGTDGTTSEQLAGELQATFADDDIAISVDLAERPAIAGDAIPQAAESRLVDGMLYLNDGTGWYVIEAPEFLSRSVVEFADPRSVLSTICHGVSGRVIRSSKVWSERSSAQLRMVIAGMNGISKKGSVSK